MKFWLVLSSLLLACLPKAESPPLHPVCDNGEYAYSGFCCQMCPAGTHVVEPCSEPHTRGRCKYCTEGEDYTAHGNGLSQCLPCDECKYGKRMVKPCTVKSNTICQCEDGFYCPPVCEECIKCTEKCPEGQTIVRKCNATANMECGAPPREAMEPITIVAIIIGVILVLGFLVLCFFKLKKICSVFKGHEDVKAALISVSKETLSPKTDVSTSENQKVQSGLGDPPSLLRKELPETSLLLNNANDLCENPSPGNAPSAPPLPLPDEPAMLTVQPNVLESNTKCPEVIVKNPSHRELNKIYYDLRCTVPHNHWNKLMRRMGLSDNDIDIIKHDNSHHADEQRYQMLRTLQDRFGIEEALRKLLNGLWDLKLMRIYENLINELISNDIITKD